MLIVELFVSIDWGVHRGLSSLFTKEVLLVTSFTQIGLVTSTFGLAKAVTNLGLGVLSDKIGRKPAIILGLILSGLGGAMIALSMTYNDMLIGTALIGVGQGSSFVGIMVSINEVVKSNRRGLAMGLFELIAYGGSSLGSAIGGYIAFAQGLRSPFFGIVIVSLVGAIVSFFTVTETREVKKTEEKSPSLDIHESYSTALKRSIPLYIAGFSSKIMDSLTVSFLPLYLAALNMNIAEITAITSAFTLSWALSQPLTGYISDKLGRKKIVLIGLASTAVCVLPYTLTDNFILMLVFSLVLGFSAALFYTPLIAIVGDISPPSLRGTLIGSYRFFRDMGYFAGPIILGIVADTYGILHSFYVTSLVLLITTAVVYVALRGTITANA